jgi:hypothetical protein
VVHKRFFEKIDPMVQSGAGLATQTEDTILLLWPPDEQILVKC